MPRWFTWGVAWGLLLTVAPGLRAGDKSFDANGVNLRYTDQGRGEAVLLIHGFGANVEVQWVFPGVVRALAGDYRVIAYDNRGHGRSGKPHDPQKYGQEMVEDAVRLLDHLNIKKAHVVGYSMGAMITAKLLVAHPDRVLTATLGGAGPYRKDVRLALFTDLLAASLEQGKGIGPLIEVLTPPGQPRPSAERLKAVNQVFTAINDTKALAAVVRGWRELSVSDAELKANRVPTLALIGALDPLKTGVDEVRGQMPELKVVVIPGADHITAVARPQFTQALKEFLAAHGTGGNGKRRAAEPAGKSR